MNLKKIISIYCNLFCIELIMGGAGQLINLGPISLRMFIFVVGFFILLIYYAKNGIEIRRINLIIFSLIIWTIISAAYGIFIANNSLPVILNEVIPYLVLLLVPLFSYNAKDDLSMKSMIKSVIVSINLQSLLIISIFIYGLSFGVASYSTVTQLFNHYNYGFYDFLPGIEIPRVFTKGSVFIPLGIFYQLLSLLNRDKNLEFSIQKIFFLIINLVALILTFTTSFYLITLLGIVLIFAFYIKDVKKIFLLVIVTIFSYIAINKLNIYNIFIQRFSSNYSLDAKFIQNTSLMDYIMENPIIGHGLGKILQLNYGYKTVFNIHAENAFLQLWVNSGLIGVFILICLFMCVLNNFLAKLKIKQEVNVDLPMLLFTISLFIVNFTNPFLNNYLGLGILVVIIAYSERRPQPL